MAEQPLRDQISVDREFMDPPLDALSMFEKLTPEEFHKLEDALQRRDAAAAASIFGVSVESLESVFKVLQERAKTFAAKYPDLADPMKGL